MALRRRLAGANTYSPLGDKDSTCTAISGNADLPGGGPFLVPSSTQAYSSEEENDAPTSSSDEDDNEDPETTPFKDIMQDSPNNNFHSYQQHRNPPWLPSESFLNALDLSATFPMTGKVFPYPLPAASNMHI